VVGKRFCQIEEGPGISRDGGSSWREESNGDENFGGVIDMKILSDLEQDRLFLGLWKGGVYEVNVSNNSQ